MSNEDLAREQVYVTMLYGHLDSLRQRAEDRLTRTLRQAGGTHQARTERDVNAAMYTGRIAQFDAAENGLCFGRLDFHEGDPRYIGRLGIRDENADYEPLLLDWRAPAARPFYLATALSPEGVRRRRHIKTRRREVLSLDDEVLDLSAADLPAAAGTRGRAGGLAGEAALLAALNAGRTGRMSDIVETIQAEQDQIIRSAHQGVMVVQGGPGTGKTAVALHRAAFLLYTHRERLERRVVLIVGPNATFLQYIGQVLPSLGETGVLLSTVGELYPGITARRAEPAVTSEVKGRLAMAGVIAAAVRDRQQVPPGTVRIVVEREEIPVRRQTCEQARRRARQARLPHNEARPIFVRELIGALARQVAGQISDNVDGEGGLLGAADVEDIRQELRESPQVWSLINRLWPALTPQRLLEDLYSSADRLAAAAPGLAAPERDALLRRPGGGWSVADVPLLDEAAELLGEDTKAIRARAERERRRRIAYAQGVLDLAAGSRSYDADTDEESEILSAPDLVDAERLAGRHEEEDYRTPAERAAADRTWTFGHIIVDEAQELSPMTWRVLMRRCPTRSMTLVGDVAQASDPAAGSDWQQILAPHVADRWRIERLQVNYRTPAEIAAVAADVLAAFDPAAEPPRPVRETGIQPWRIQAAPAGLPDRLAGLAAAEAAELGEGRLGVIVPVSRLAELSAAITAVLPSAAVGEDPDLQSPVVVLTVRQAKGLEFDSVLVADPGQIIADSARGLSDLYVALTRATQRLGVVHAGAVPAVLARLAACEDAQPEKVH